MRKIMVHNIAKNSPNKLQKVANFQNSNSKQKNYLPTYEENVFPAAREALTSGKFHNMFMAGDGHELEDYTDKKGVLHLAHAKSIYSSSMLAYNFFYWVSPEQPLVLHGTTYDKVYFEVKFPVLAINSNGSRNNSPSNMDIVLISDDCQTIFCIESKYTEHTHHHAAIFKGAYFKSSCYYKDNPYRTSFIKYALRYNEKKNGYFAGIKQNISHIIGITNILHDADALAWFKENNPFIEPKVLAQINQNTEIIFTNLLYYRPEMGTNIYGDIHAEEKTYPYLLAELLLERFERALDEPLLLSRFITTYPELFVEIQAQMPNGLAEYLDNKYILANHAAYK